MNKLKILLQAAARALGREEKAFVGDAAGMKHKPSKAAVAEARPATPKEDPWGDPDHRQGGTNIDVSSSPKAGERLGDDKRPLTDAEWEKFKADSIPTSGVFPVVIKESRGRPEVSRNLVVDMGKPPVDDKGNPLSLAPRLDAEPGDAWQAARDRMRAADLGRNTVVRAHSAADVPNRVWNNLQARGREQMLAGYEPPISRISPQQAAHLRKTREARDLLDAQEAGRQSLVSKTEPAPLPLREDKDAMLKAAAERNYRAQIERSSAAAAKADAVPAWQKPSPRSQGKGGPS